MKKKILVIEDDPDVLENIVELLREESYEVLGARNGMEGYGYVKTYHPDLVLCDIAMPLLDGLELLKLFRGEKVNFDKPFIFLSARISRENVREGMSLGADDYLTKPFTRKEILDAVTTRLNKATSLDDKNTQLRENIVTSLPHELLTPLNAIYMGSDLLREADSVLTKNEVHEFGELIFSSATVLKHIFSKYLCLLDIFVTRSDEKEISRLAGEFCNLSDNYIKIIATTKAEEYNRIQDLKMKVDRATVKIYDKHLFRIVRELVDNAFKFSLPGSIVTVLGGTSFTTYLLSVSNTGSTMSEEQISLVGEFMQFGKEKTSSGGLGLGLAIVKNLCGNYNAAFDISRTDNSVTVNCRFNIRK